MDIKQGEPVMLNHNGIEYVNCNLCGANDTKLVFHLNVRSQHVGKYNRDVWDIVRCQRCGLVYENPRPDAAALQNFYTFESFADRSFVQDWFVNNADLNQVTWQRLLRAIRRYRSSGQLLDVGCGAGTFLVEARRAGFEVAGQEVAPFFVNYCREQENLTIYDGELDTMEIESTSLDIITAFDMIEHHPDPKRLVTEIRRLLRPGGLFVISTHDIGNFFAKLYGTHWRHMMAIGHIFYFTRPSMTKLLRTSGFEILHQSSAHIVDQTALAEFYNFIIGFFKLIILRALILGIYKPLTIFFPFLTRWQFRWWGKILDHSKLMTRAGTQIVLGDDMVFLAKAV
jgi:2-polyprenyl-3-methyl-5-hydroxy-6-metoxy-1,4-benzoquinol methylase